MSNRALENVSNYLTKRFIEEEKKRIYAGDSIIPDLKKEFIDTFDIDFQAAFQIKQFCKIYPIETKSIILKYYDKCKKEKYDSEHATLLDCLCTEKNKDLVPFFVDEFYKHYKSDVVLDGLGNCLMVTADKKYLDIYLKMLEDECFSEEEHFRVLYIFEKIKSPEVPKLLIKMIEKEYCLWICLRCLSKYKSEKYLPVFRKYINHSDSEIRGIAKRAINKIEKNMNKEK